jgi:hypothetical protein
VPGRALTDLLGLLYFLLKRSVMDEERVLFAEAAEAAALCSKIVDGHVEGTERLVAIVRGVLGP